MPRYHFLPQKDWVPFGQALQLAEFRRRYAGGISEEVTLYARLQMDAGKILPPGLHRYIESI